MAPGRRKGSSGRAAAAAAAKAQQYKVGDLVLAKMKGFPAWPAVISEPEQWGYAPVRKKLLVYFYGTKQIAFCNYADIEAFTEEKKKSLLLKRQGKGADFIRALNEIIHIFDTLKNKNVKEASLAIGEIKTDAEVNECLRSNSLRKIRKGSYKAADNDLEVALALDNCDDNHGVSATSTYDYSSQNELSNSEPTEEVSIVDRFRKSPSETSTVSRKKRLKGASLNSTLSRKRTPRTLSSSGSPKNGDSDLLDGLNLSGTDYNHDSQEDPLHKKSSSASDLNDVVKDSFKLTTNIGSEDAETEQVAKGYESSNMNEKKKVESSQAVEISVNGCLNTEVPSNGKLDLLTTIVFCKKKRKSNRKPLNTMRQDKEHYSQVENCSSHFKSPYHRIAMAEQDIKPDGDEHLPLVKRARVRMEKTGEEVQLSVLPNILEKPEPKESTSNFDDYCASPNASTSEGSFKDINASNANNMSMPSAKNDVLFWKTKKYQISGFEMDAEAALPPSKRLHRALEAMSANAAEAKGDCFNSPEAPESNGCFSSQAISSLRICMDDTDQKTTLNIQPFVGSNEHKSNISKLPSECSDVPALSSDCSAMQIECNGLMEDAAKCSGISISCSNSDIKNKVLKPCSSSNEFNATLYEGTNNQICSPLGQVNESEVIKEESNNSPTNNVVGDATRKSVMIKKECVLKSEGLIQFFPLDGCYTESSAGAVATAINTSEVTNDDRFHTDGELESREMQDIATECKTRLTPYQTRNSPDLTSMKELIAAAQARRLPSCSVSFMDNNVDTRLIVESLASPIMLKEDISGRVSPPKWPVTHPIIADDRTNNVYKGGVGSNASHQLKGLKFSIDLESNAVKKSFEAFICTLTRTKESIGRATRMAIDCAKYGIAREVIDILLQNLEREPSLHRRIDLFFLVDSITQCSRNLKGGAGDVYPSLVQSVLPRLLSAAAPRGNAAFENRRQCLKVLKLWLERRILPEAMIRHHIRELDSVDEVLLASSSRRPSRTERAFNDPVREMEGMLVDEYGSNTGFQLSCLNFNVLDDEEGSASDEKTLEAVTPERLDEVDHEKEATEKHRHVLEAVDGELEMEDVAPTCVAELIAGVDGSSCTHQDDEHYSSSFIPPLPENSPPSPPPLPLSPPPSPTCPTTDSLVPEQQMIPLAIGEPADLHFSGTNNVIQMSKSQPLCRHPVPNYGPGYEGHHIQMPPSVPSNNSSCFSNFSVPQPALHSQNSCLPLASTPVPNKAYAVQPPPPTISNNFSYVQAETQQKPRPWGNCSSFPERFQYLHDGVRVHCYGDQGNNGRYHHDMIERDKFSPLPRPGPSHCEKVDIPPPACHYGPSETPRFPSNGWLPCPRVSNYYPLSTTRSSVEGPTAPLAGGKMKQTPPLMAMIACMSNSSNFFFLTRTFSPCFVSLYLNCLVH